MFLFSKAAVGPGQGLNASAPRQNAFLGKLGANAAQRSARRQGIQLCPDHVAVLAFTIIARSPVLVIHALAGTGKSTVAGFIMEAYAQKAPRGGVVVI